MFWSKFATNAGVSLLAVQLASGAVILDPSLIGDYQALGSFYPGAMALNLRYDDGSTIINYFGSGVLIGKDEQKMVSYFITATHLTGDPLTQSLTSVAFGADRRVPEGYLSDVKLEYRSPNYDNFNANMGFDVSVYSTSTLFPDNFYRPIAPSITANERVTSVGYGTVSSPGIGRLDQFRGLRLGWNGDVTFNGTLNTDPATTRSIVLDKLIHLGGASNPGDSGSPVYNSSGSLIGLVLGGTPTIPDYSTDIRTTQIFDITPGTGSAYYNQISPYVGIVPAVPESTPGALAMVSTLAGIACFRRHWRNMV